MFVRTVITFIIVSAMEVVLLSCSSSEPAIDYLALNYNKTEHFNGMTPNRLRNLQGHIRSVTQYVYPLEVQADGTTRRGKLVSGTPVYTLLFTRDGLITEEWGYRVEDIVAHKTWYRSHRLYQVDSTIHWDDNGNMTSKEVYTYDKDNILVGGYHEYDGQRREKVLNIAKSGDTLVVAERWAKICYVNGRRVKVADNNGVRTYRYNYFPSGALQQKIVMERGKVNLEERFDESGNLLYRLSTSYRDGRLNYSNERTITYHNDLREQEIEKNFDEPHAWTDTFTYEYKDRRRVRSFKDGQPFGFYEYNEHNDVLRERNEWFNEGYRYISYDAQGNWTERILLAGDKPFHVEVRKFEYY
jgi:antitoxin component YwqK of YwqJK toxin-antitoxin module